MSTQATLVTGIGHNSIARHIRRDSMDKTSRDASGYQFSTQAAETLDKIEFTPEGISNCRKSQELSYQDIGYASSCAAVRSVSPGWNEIQIDGGNMC